MTGQLSGLAEALAEQLETHGPYVLFIAFIGFLAVGGLAWGRTELLPHEPEPTDAPPPPENDRPRYFHCPTCGSRSHHPEDIRQGWCGRCRAYTGRPEGLDIRTDHRRTA